MAADHATTAALALRELCREERRLVEGRRLLELPQLVERRRDAMRELADALPPSPAAEAEVQRILADVQREAAENLALLRSIQGELSAEMSDDARRGRAARGYSRNA